MCATADNYEAFNVLRMVDGVVEGHGAAHGVAGEDEGREVP